MRARRWLARGALALLSVLALVLVALAVWDRSALHPDLATAELLERERTVTIVRDRWGVPTVQGQTDADVAFGIALAHAADDFALVTLTFRADEVGTGDLGLGVFTDFLFANEGDFGTATFFQADVLDAFVTVDVAAVPVPAAALLFPLGLAGLAAARRKS